MEEVFIPDAPVVRAIGRHVVVRVQRNEERVGSIIMLTNKGRARLGRVQSVGARVRGIDLNSLVEFDPYRLIACWGRDGWRGAASEVGEPGGLAILDYESIYLVREEADEAW